MNFILPGHLPVKNTHVSVETCENATFVHTHDMSNTLTDANPECAT